MEAAVRGADILVVAPTGMGKVIFDFSVRLETEIASVRVSASKFPPLRTKWIIQRSIAGWILTRFDSMESHSWFPLSLVRSFPQ